MRLLKVVRCYLQGHPLTSRVWIPHLHPDPGPVKVVYSVEMSEEVMIDSSAVFLTYYHPACFCWKRISDEVRNGYEGFFRVSGPSSGGSFSIGSLGPLPFDVDIEDPYAAEEQ